nr:hypothetical protein [Caulifigura coniformis]
MDDLKARIPNLSNAFQLVGERVALVGTQVVANMSEHAIALAFADVERFAISGVDESVDVGLDLRADIGRELDVIEGVWGDLSPSIRAAIVSLVEAALPKSNGDAHPL